MSHWSGGDVIGSRGDRAENGLASDLQFMVLFSWMIELVVFVFPVASHRFPLGRRILEKAQNWPELQPMAYPLRSIRESASNQAK